MCLCEERGRPGEGRAGTKAPGQEPRAGLQRTAREEGTWGTGAAGRGRHSLTAVLGWWRWRRWEVAAFHPPGRSGQRDLPVAWMGVRGGGVRPVV